MDAVTFIHGMGRRRLLTHAALALLSIGSVYAARFYAPRGALAYVATLGLGYLSLVLIVLTLIIGPLNLLRRRRNPVNIDLRRDIGIWAGITGLLHVVFALQIHMQGQVLYYFFRYSESGLRPLLNLFGISNYVGALATALLIVLLVTSNSLVLRRLKGRRWKTIQRLNYVLAVLVFLHTIGFQMVSRREAPFTTATIALAAVLLAAQVIGVTLYDWRRRRQQRGRPALR